MKKAIIILLLILVAAFTKGYSVSYAKEKEVGFNVSAIDNDQSNQGKNKIQFRTEINPKTQGSEFMIKGVITASSSGSIVIDGKTINLNSSVTGNIKIVGAINVGSYTMVQGIIKDSNLYAEKIVVDQRNKKETGENESPTPAATHSASLEKNENEHASTNMNLNNLIASIQNLLNYLQKLAVKI